MGKILRTNEDRQNRMPLEAASAFAQVALAHVGGSSVFIEPKKTRGKLLDLDKVE